MKLARACATCPSNLKLAGMFNVYNATGGGFHGDDFLVFDAEAIQRGLEDVHDGAGTH